MANTPTSPKPLIFRVVSKPSDVPKSAERVAFLIEDNWDDWNKYQTQFHLIVFDDSGVPQTVGYLKIGEFGLKPSPTISKGHRRPAVMRQFSELGDRCFSLGQEDSYYERLSKLGEELREQILQSLRDIAADQILWERARNEPVTLESLLRSVQKRSVEGQFRRLAHGGLRLTSYELVYTPPKQTGTDDPPFVLSFDVNPESHPPTNIHVLIGPNGVGKTRILYLMTKALLAPSFQSEESGAFSTPSAMGASSGITNLVSVSFSAFDDFELLPERRRVKQGIQYSYVGLRRTTNIGNAKGSPKSAEILERDFVKSVKQCLKGERANRWRSTLEALQNDPIFKASEVTALTDYQVGQKELDKNASALFRGLSAGHKIVLLTVTKLVETVEEQTLILLDEPEAHLHPPLLSAFVRALSELLINRNGLAIVATHSPVVLQEVPKTCVWMLQRSGNESKAERPEAETFGENVGALTRTVFGLEARQSGFQKMLKEAVDMEPSFELALEYFNNELGAEARAILRALFVTKRTEGDE